MRLLVEKLTHVSILHGSINTTAKSQSEAWQLSPSIHPLSHSFHSIADAHSMLEPVLGPGKTPITNLR